MAAVEPRERHGARAAGQADPVHDLGDGADARELALVARNEQHALLVADVERERNVHVGKDDYVFERYEQQCAH